MFHFLRLCCATLSACIFVNHMPNPAHLLFRLSPYDLCASAYGEAEWLWYEDLPFKLQVITAALWIALWAFLELRTFRRRPSPAPKILTHLRYGPIAIFVFSMIAILATDFALIRYSRWQIVWYIHSDAPVTERPSFRLHNDYRHWCGNGMAANEYALYGDTPAAYIDDADPATRARALRASMYVYDWINNSNDGPSIAALKKASVDPDPTVRDLAASYTAKLRMTGAIP